MARAAGVTALVKRQKIMAAKAKNSYLRNDRAFHSCVNPARSMFMPTVTPSDVIKIAQTI